MTVTARANLAFTPPLDDVSGMDVKLDYPGPKLQLQGNPVNTSGVSGVFQFGNNDTDTPNDGFEDQLTAGLLAIPGNIPPGQLFSATFACRDGASAPTSGEFSCEATGSTLLGAEFTPTCTVSTTVTP